MSVVPRACWRSLDERNVAVRVSDQLEVAYPKLQGKTDVIRMVINVYRQIQQEAFGIVLINRHNKVGRSPARGRDDGMNLGCRCFWYRTRSTTGVFRRAS